jgi:hypothetical protein
MGLRSWTDYAVGGADVGHPAIQEIRDAGLRASKTAGEKAVVRSVNRFIREIGAEPITERNPEIQRNLKELIKDALVVRNNVVWDRDATSHDTDSNVHDFLVKNGVYASIEDVTAKLDQIAGKYNQLYGSLLAAGAKTASTSTQTR